MTVIPFKPSQTMLEHAWNEYVRLVTTANKTLAFQDGLAAARAYRRFLQMTDEAETGANH